MRRSQIRTARRNKEERIRPKSAIDSEFDGQRRIINGGGIGGSRAFRSMAGNLNNFALREKTPPVEFGGFEGKRDFQSLAEVYYDNRANNNTFRR